jgi:hypothetical protein
MYAADYISLLTERTIVSWSISINMLLLRSKVGEQVLQSNTGRVGELH